MKNTFLKERLLKELNVQKMLSFSQLQKLKEEHLSKDTIESMLAKYQKQKKAHQFIYAILLLVIIGIQTFVLLKANDLLFWHIAVYELIPVLGIQFFIVQRQNYAKQIFILKLLLEMEE